MSEAVEEIISDEEVARVHYGQWGDQTPRQVIAEGVLKYAFGYASGHTVLTILQGHGLIRKPKPGSYHSTLTKRGYRYLRAAWSYRAIVGSLP